MSTKIIPVCALRLHVLDILGQIAELFECRIKGGWVDPEEKCEKVLDFTQLGFTDHV